MDRGPLLRKAGLAVAGLAVLGGAVIALRSPEEPGTSQPPAQPPQTSVTKYAAEGVVLPEPGPKPPAPTPLKVTPGPHRLLVTWTDFPAPATIAGYEVRWGVRGSLTNSRLVAEPQAQLDGLDDGKTYDVQVRSVDGFGQRSTIAAASGTPGTPPDELAYTFVDRFDGQAVPDATNWRFASPGACGRATRGDGQDAKRLVISANCGAASVALRARAPFKLTSGGASRGEVVIDTDSPGEAGQLMIDLVPGSADLIDGSPSGPPKPGKPGVAQQDPALPPGTIRVLVTSTPADHANPKTSTTVQVLTAPNVRNNGHVVQKIQPMPVPRIGENVRWQVVFGKDNVGVLRNGVLVGGGDVTPTWQQATALFGFVGPSGGFRTGVAMIGFTGAPTAPPVALTTPDVRTSRTVGQTGMVLNTPTGTRIPDVQSAQLRLSLLPQADQKLTSLDGSLSVDVGGKRVLATPAVRGQPLKRGVRYPVVALLPKDALILTGNPALLDVAVSSNVQQKGLATRIEFSDIELFPASGVTPPPVAQPNDKPLPAPHAAVARAEAEMLGATGQPLAEGATAVPGRVLVDVHLDGPAAQRISGALAGLGGIEIRLDGRKIAAFPTTVDGPGVGGQWRLPLTTNQFGTGPHIIEVRAVGVDAETLYASTVLSFTV